MWLAMAKMKMSRGEAERIMRRSGWLAHMPEAFQADLLHEALLLRFAPGELIFRHGDPLGGIYGLVCGIVTVNAAAVGATPRLIHLGIPGTWGGEGCFLTRQPRRVELRTSSETWLMHVPLEAMERLAARDPLASRAFGAIATFNADILQRTVHDLQKRNPARRIASVLQRAASPHASVPLSQADLGTMANASRQQVNAAIRQFASTGWVRSGYRSIAVLQPQALQRFAESDDD